MSLGSFDAVIVGAGIVGAACARELAADGLRVAICEENDHVGGGATAVGMGHLAVMDDSEAQFNLTRFSQYLWRELSDELPREAEYLPCGSLWVAADEEEFREAERKYRFYSQHGVSAHLLDTKQTAEAEPKLRPGLRGALHLPADSVCYPPAAARHFSEQVIAAGGQVFLQERVKRVSDSGVALSSGQILSAGLMILATGAAVQELQPDVDVRARKGHLLITDRYPGFLRHQVIELGYLKSAHSVTRDSVAFNAQPRATGQVLIGSSRQYGVEDAAVDKGILGSMLRRAFEYLPGLADLQAIRAWTGFRAATPDKLPLVGLCPGFQNVYLATGHEGLGITTSLATARLLADEILDRSSQISRLPYDPSRSFALHA